MKGLRLKDFFSQVTADKKSLLTAMQSAVS